MDLRLVGTPQQLQALALSGYLQELQDETGNKGYSYKKEDKQALIFAGFLRAFDTWEGKEINWNPALDPDPRVKGNGSRGNETGKGAFKYHPYIHPRGISFQSLIKPGIVEFIYLIHWLILKLYDPQAYIFEDKRLLIFAGILRSFAAEYFQDGAKDGNPRKLKFMNYLFDIFLFILKEDIHFRGRIFELLNKLMRFELTEAEIQNLEEFQ